MSFGRRLLTSRCWSTWLVDSHPKPLGLLPRCAHRLYSKKEASALTLDDVLPTPSSQGSPMSRQAAPFETTSILQSHAGDRFNFSPSLARRAGVELTSDPLRRKPGERTHYSLIVQSTPNNTRLTLTHTPVAYLPGSSPGSAVFQKAFPAAGSVVARVTAGSVGFKRGKRQEYEAATQATLAMFNKIREIMVRSPSVNDRAALRHGTPRELEVVFDGFGVGRDAFVSSMMNSQATDLREIVRSVRDTTTVKIGGPRPKKMRRV